MTEKGLKINRVKSWFKGKRTPVGESEGRSGVKRGEDRNDPSHSRVACDLIFNQRFKSKVNYSSNHNIL